MRDVTVEELEMVNGGDWEGFMTYITGLLGSSNTTNPTMSGDQAYNAVMQCMSNGGNASYSSGYVTGGASGSGGAYVFTANISGSNQHFSCTFG